LFHLIFHGHTHNATINTINKNNQGIVIVCSEASLSNINQYEHIGFSILDVDTQGMSLNIENYRIDSNYNVYPANTSNDIKIPVEEEKRKFIDFRKKTSKLYDDELSIAQGLFVSNYNSENFFENLFSDPVLKSSASVSLKNIAKKTDTTKNVTIQEILRDNLNHYHIYGKDKYGKTSILYYLLLNTLKDLSNNNTLPIFIDCGDKSSIKERNIDDLFCNKYQIRKSFFNELKQEYKIKLFLDNFNKVSNDFNEKIKDFIHNNNNVTYVATFDELLMSEFNDIKINDINPIKLYIHDLTTKHIASITSKTLKCNEEKTNEIIGKVKSIFSQLNLPLNYWNISLFLWIFNSTNQQNFHNNFELLQLYIDNLLDRQSLVTDRDLKITYDSLKKFLGELAYNLLTNYHEEGYKITYSQLINFIESYIQSNIRFVIKSKNLFDLLIEKGILKEYEDEKFTFRLNGIFEFFVAYYLKDHKKETNGIIEDDAVYISFGNELELISGFNNTDEEFVMAIFNKSKNLYEKINNEYKSLGDADQILISKSSQFRSLSTNYQKSVSAYFKVESLDDSSPLKSQAQIQNGEVIQKKIYSNIELNPENLERILFIMCRGYRNSSLEDKDLNNKILDFILESACNLCFSYMDLKDITEEDYQSFAKIFSNFIPIIIQTFLLDALSQNNLEVLFLSKIEELKRNKTGNELKLFVLYYILIDLDLKNNKKYIDDCLAVLSIKVLKYASLFKLLSFILFKKYYNDSTLTYIENAIMDNAKLIDNSTTNKNNTRKMIENIKNINTLKIE